MHACPRERAARGRGDFTCKDKREGGSELRTFDRPPSDRRKPELLLLLLMMPMWMRGLEERERSGWEELAEDAMHRKIVRELARACRQSNEKLITNNLVTYPL